MPLRDHFRSPLDDVHSWDELHGGWPMMIVRQLLAEACQTLGGRGGGKPELAQGGGPNAERLEEALGAASSKIKGF